MFLTSQKHTSSAQLLDYHIRGQHKHVWSIRENERGGHRSLFQAHIFYMIILLFIVCEVTTKRCPEREGKEVEKKKTILCGCDQLHRIDNNGGGGDNEKE